MAIKNKKFSKSERNEQLEYQEIYLKNIIDKSTSLIQKIFSSDKINIKNITYNNKSMTNNSFTFSYKDNDYIIRVPGEGTDKLIDRNKEIVIYEKLKNLNLIEDLIYIDASGYKISKFYDCRVCDKDNIEDVSKCISALKTFHQNNFKIDYYFDVFNNIDYYESLWNSSSEHLDYNQIKENIMSLKSFIEKQDKRLVLCHIDPNYDNFLILKNERGNETIKLIDWEYSGMQDPDIDIAMFCLYACYEKEKIDEIIDIYYNNECDDSRRMKIYSYISIGGLLWSNWCEYKKQLGITYGDYANIQYEYAKKYFDIVNNWRKNV